MFPVNQHAQLKSCPVKILIVDGAASSIESLQDAFMSDVVQSTLPQFVVSVVDTAHEALQHCLNAMPDCILIANQLTDMSGLELITLLLASERRYMPALILMIGANESNVVSDALKLGVQDYLVKEETKPKQVGWTIHNALERNRLLHQLMEKQNELEMFAGQVAHDMLSPLTNLSLSVEYLSDQLGTNASPELSTTFDSMSSIVDYMASIIDGLSNYASTGGQSNSFSPIDLQEIFEYIQLILGYEIEITGTKIHCDTLPTIYGDKGGLSQLLQNLIGNAIKYSGDKTPEISVCSRPRANDWLISVADNGIGIDPANHAKIFKPFQRLHSRAEYPGSGLGLSTCKKVVDKHRGKIWAESEVGQGTTFYVTLPKMQPEQFLSILPREDTELSSGSASIGRDALLELEVPLRPITN